MLNIVYITLGLFLLIFGGNWSLKAAVMLSLRLHISKIVIAMTVVSFTTSAPELIVSIHAALSGSPDLSLGNVVGSNIANLGLVLAVILILNSIPIKKSFYTTDWPVVMFASGIFYFFIANDSMLERYEGILLFGFLVLFLIYLIKFQKQVTTDEVSQYDKPLKLWKIILLLILGGVGLWVGSELLIYGAKSFAVAMGVSERIIGITLLSLGTSIPELATSIIAILKKEKGMSLGNLLGSNIFNIFAVLGITAIITPIKIMDERLITLDIYWMLGITVLLCLLVLVSKKGKLSWHSGVFLLMAYIGFLYTAV